MFLCCRFFPLKFYLLLKQVTLLEMVWKTKDLTGRSPECVRQGAAFKINANKINLIKNEDSGGSFSKRSPHFCVCGWAPTLTEWGLGQGPRGAGPRGGE